MAVRTRGIENFILTSSKNDTVKTEYGMHKDKNRKLSGC
ncbi:hypothetical protein CCHR01_12324 [Colletotrichum chrysophilum]|uniref:Uncharacterized protein n=1 Tax=Colletotrichum chrysophilum TaxID=1836956 RepID=A0AAD9EET9_9PEZI|nr:hypothetical protein CCHR01_12324 [Colletotrichum chrysophilum]